MKNTSIVDLFQYEWNTKNNVEPTEDELNKLLIHLKTIYQQKTDFMNLESDMIPLFSWLSHAVTIHALHIATRDKGHYRIFYIAEKSVDTNDHIQWHELTNETNNYQFTHYNRLSEKLMYLISHENIDIKPENIINASVTSSQLRIDLWIESWTSAEFKDNITELKLPSIDLVDFDSVSLHRSQFEFDELLTTLDNEQFSAELNEVLFAYNNKKWFITAASIGSLLEHLMYLTLKNYGDTGGLRNATAGKYISKFLDNNHIEFDDRQERGIRQLFETRNTVSHHNDGYTGKTQCDMMLNGVKTLFTTYYLPSLAFAQVD